MLTTNFFQPFLCLFSSGQQCHCLGIFPKCICPGADAVEWIGKAFADQSALLKHELAYCLGQMQDTRAIPTLTAVLRDREQEAMVRHEAGTQAPQQSLLLLHRVCVSGSSSLRSLTSSHCVRFLSQFTNSASKLEILPFSRPL